MTALFEYRNSIPDNFEGLEDFLDEIWKHREKSPYFTGSEAEQSEGQNFLQFLYRSGEIRSKKYVGVIHYQGKRIDLLPKIFYDSEKTPGDRDIYTMQRHILWWLSYCRRIRFPNYQTAQGQIKSDFFEVLIHLFARFTRELLGSSIFQQYEELQREVTFYKGRLDTNRYIGDSLAKGDWHKLHCIYDAFIMDNAFNRIVKYVATLLFNVTGDDQNRKDLREILFILDEVADEPASAEQCDRIQFNPVFSEFETVRDYCRLFLSGSISFDYKNDLKLFAFLLPMEYVFEDFIYGFINRELPGIKVRAQSTAKTLDESGIFTLKPDLLLEIDGKSLIADTKYKVVYADDRDPKNGITQSDLYQMLSYAVRFDIDRVYLLYPEPLVGIGSGESEFVIRDALAGGRKIRVYAVQLPVIDKSMFHALPAENAHLNSEFSNAANLLKERLENLFLRT